MNGGTTISGRESDFVLSFLRDLLGLLAALSVLIYYWGYLALSTPLKAVFGVSLPFLSQDYWQVGFEYLLQIGLVLSPGYIVGLLVVARNPNFDASRGIRLMSMLIGIASILLLGCARMFPVSGNLLMLLRSGGLCGLTYLLTVFVAGTGQLHMLLSDKEREGQLLERLIEKQEHELTLRANAPDLLRLRSGQPGDKLLATDQEKGQEVLAQRLTESRKYLEQVQATRRQARMHLTVITVLCISFVMLLLPFTKDYVVESSMRLNWGTYPIVSMVTSKPIPELSLIPSPFGEPMYKVRLVLRSEGQVFVTSVDDNRPLILSAADVVRLLPETTPPKS